MQIFLIDDDHIFNYLHEAVIKSAIPEATVTCFKSGLELMSFIENAGTSFTPPDIILMDVRMPEMDGFKLLDTLEANHGITFKNTPIFMLSSTLDERDLQKANSYRMVSAFLEKPLTIELFEKILSNLK